VNDAEFWAAISALGGRGRAQQTRRSWAGDDLAVLRGPRRVVPCCRRPGSRRPHRARARSPGRPAADDEGDADDDV